MPDRLEQLMRGLKSAGNVHNVPRDLVEILADDLSCLEPLEPGLGADCLAYVLDGEPQRVLSSVAARPEAHKALQLDVIFGRDATHRRTPFYERIEEVAPAVCLRLAKLLAAVPAHYQPLPLLGLSQQALWPEVLLNDVLRVVPAIGPPGAKKEIGGPSFDYLEKLLAEDGLPAPAIIASSFLSDMKQGLYSSHHIEGLAFLPGFSAAVERHANVIRPVFLSRSHEQRLHALAMLKQVEPETLHCFAHELVGLCTDSSNKVRTAASAVAVRLGTDAFPIARDIALKGKPEERGMALRFIWALGGRLGYTEALDFVRQRADVEKTQSVLDTIAELQARAAVAETGRVEEIACDEPRVDLEAKLAPEAKAVLEERFDLINRQIEKDTARYNNPPGSSHPPTITSAELDAIWIYIQGESPRCPKLSQCVFPPYMVNEHVLGMVHDLMAKPGFAPIHAVRLLEALRGPFSPRDPDHERLPRLMNACVEELYRHTGHPTLLDLQIMLDSLGLDSRAIALDYMENCWGWGTSLASHWENAAVWPYFAGNLSILEEWLQPGAAINQDYRFDRTKLFRALSTFPEPPAQLVPRLLDLALGSGKKDRLMAQMALARLPHKEKHIIAALTSRKLETRVEAATWLAELKSMDAVPALEATLKKEKNDLALGAIMNALERLGVPVDSFLNLKGLPEEAEKGLARGVPAGLTWFPFDILPVVRWAESGEPVAPQILKWLIVKAFKLKKPEPDPILRRHTALFDPRDREKLGQMVLEAWLRQDVLPISREEAEKRALGQAQQIYQTYQQHAQYLQNSPLLGKSVDELYQSFLPAALAQPAGSAMASKGMLAVAGACSGGRAAPVVARYLKQWYGTRPAQGKTLIAMLAWIEHPAATQLMLAIGNRFRTKSFQDEAMRQVELLAARKGWSVSELADRTIPSAGFDETGEMELPYGGRTFVARLGNDLKIDLLNPEGKRISALPEPRKDEDAGQAGEAKKALSFARKELSGVVRLQTERLYEAMCTQRTWRFEDWSLYSWNYALLLAEGPTPRALVPAPLYHGMKRGEVVRFEKITRVQPEIQDCLISVLSDKVLHIPELTGEDTFVFAASGFNVVATANLRDCGVHEMSSALKRRFNFETVHPIGDKRMELQLVREQTERLVREAQVNAQWKEEVVELLVTTFNDLRRGITDEGIVVEKPTAVMSTAEAVAVGFAASLDACYFGSGAVDGGHIARQLIGTVLKDNPDDGKKLRHYFDAAIFWNALRFLLEREPVPPPLVGAVHGILFTAGALEATEIINRARGELQGRSQPHQAVAYLRGLLRTAREVCWQLPDLLSLLNDQMAAWSEEQFLHALPELRLAFSEMTPRETDRIAATVAGMHGATSLGPLVTYELTVEELNGWSRWSHDSALETIAGTAHHI